MKIEFEKEIKKIIDKNLDKKALNINVKQESNGEEEPDYNEIFFSKSNKTICVRSSTNNLQELKEITKELNSLFKGESCPSYVG